MALYDITALGSALEFDTSNATDKYTIRVTDTRFVTVWQNSSTVKYVQCFELNRSTGNITALSSPLKFYSSSLTWGTNLKGTLVPINSGLFTILHHVAGNNAYAITCQINSSTGQITKLGTGYKFDPSSCTGISGVLMSVNSTYAYSLATWGSVGANTKAVILRTTLSNGAVTSMGTALTVLAKRSMITSVSKISDTKALVVFDNSNDNTGDSVVLSIDTSTWAVTLAGSVYTWMRATVYVYQNSCEIINDSSILALNAYEEYRTFGIRPLSINTSTWAITNLGSVTTLFTASATIQKNSQKILYRIDDTHFIVFYTDTNGDGFARTYSINASTGAITTLSTLEFDTSDGSYISVADMGSGLFTISYTGVSGDGFVKTIQVEVVKPTNTQINIGDTWKTVESMQINIGDTWKDVESIQINIGDSWKTIY